MVKLLKTPVGYNIILHHAIQPNKACKEFGMKFKLFRTYMIMQCRKVQMRWTPLNTVKTSWNHKKKAHSNVAFNRSQMNHNPSYSTALPCELLSISRLDSTGNCSQSLWIRSLIRALSNYTTLLSRKQDSTTCGVSLYRLLLPHTHCCPESRFHNMWHLIIQITPVRLCPHIQWRWRGRRTGHHGKKEE